MPGTKVSLKKSIIQKDEEKEIEAKYSPMTSLQEREISSLTVPIEPTSGGGELLMIIFTNQKDSE